MARKPSKSTLKKKVWATFAKFIKYRDAKGVDEQGTYCFCCTCGKKIYIGSQDCHAGHYIQRRILSVKYDEQNVHAQCGMKCNKYGSGEPQLYRMFLCEKYGVDTAERLDLARKDYEPGTHEKGIVFVREQLQEYKDKLKYEKKKFDTLNNITINDLQWL